MYLDKIDLENWFFLQLSDMQMLANGEILRQICPGDFEFAEVAFMGGLICENS